MKIPKTFCIFKPSLIRKLLFYSNIVPFVEKGPDYRVGVVVKNEQGGYFMDRTTHERDIHE